MNEKKEWLRWKREDNATKGEREQYTCSVRHGIRRLGRHVVMTKLRFTPRLGEGRNAYVPSWLT